MFHWMYKMFIKSRELMDNKIFIFPFSRDILINCHSYEFVFDWSSTGKKVQLNTYMYNMYRCWFCISIIHVYLRSTFYTLCTFLIPRIECFAIHFYFTFNDSISVQDTIRWSIKIIACIINVAVIEIAFTDSFQITYISTLKIKLKFYNL